MATSERSIAVEQQAKLQFYLIGLVFTLLAASVQTAKLGVSPLHDAAELIGWLALLISGLAGLWYLELNPVLRLKMVQLDEYREELTKLRQVEATGATTVFAADLQRNQPLRPIVANRQAAVDALVNYIPKLEKWQGRRYNVFRWAFLIGLVLVAISRAWPAFF